MENQIAEWVGYVAGVLFGVRYALGALLAVLDAIDRLDGRVDWPVVPMLAAAIERLDRALEWLPVKPLGPGRYRD